MGCCHLLVEKDSCVLIDTGLVGEGFLIRGLMRKLGLHPSALKAILLTHGHLDHTANLASLKKWSGATTYAHEQEVRHVAGNYPYEGSSKWCGRLETIGRVILRYRPAPIDRFINDGDILPFYGGLRVAHLPGHTRGHCGFYSERHDLLFCGDMFGSYFFSVHKFPAVLNTAEKQFPESLEKIRRLNPKWILPSHYDRTDGSLHRDRFAKLFGIKEWQA
jgi:glyoxylase-like metal-dependent hydrolase (beta-lactamase superfamily II)